MSAKPRYKIVRLAVCQMHAVHGPDMVFFATRCTPDQIKRGLHLKYARQESRLAGHVPKLVFDDTTKVGRQVMKFHTDKTWSELAWPTMSTVDQSLRLHARWRRQARSTETACKRS